MRPPAAIDPAPDVGSPALADALARRDADAIAGALAAGWVVVPVRRSGDAPAEIRLFSPGNDPHPAGWELPLFSSVATLAAFLARDTSREFDFVRAASLASFLERGRGVIARVVFDPAGPHAVAASVDDVLAAISIGAAAPDAVDPPRGFVDSDRVLDLDLPLGEDWFRIELGDETARSSQVRELVDRQLAGLEVGPAFRAQLAQWLRRMSSTAAAGGGRETAFLLRRSADAALALSMTRYWQTLGAGLRTASHLDAVSERISRRLGPDDELIGTTTPAARLLRHARVVGGNRDLRAEGVRLLSVDYWLEHPDGSGLSLVSFSTPHLAQRDVIVRLTDQIVIESTWVVAATEPAR